MNNQHTILSKRLHSLIFNFKSPGRDLSFSSKTWRLEVQCTTSPARSDNVSLTQCRDMYVHIFMDTARGFVFNTHKYLPYIFFLIKQIHLPSFLLYFSGRQLWCQKTFPFVKQQQPNIHCYCVFI